MRNKLKRNKARKNAGCSRENQEQNIEVIILSSESGCSDVEAPFDKNNPTPLGKNKQNGSKTISGSSEPQTPRLQPDQFIKEVDPIFLRSTFQRKCIKGDELSKTSPERVKSHRGHTNNTEVGPSPCEQLSTRLKEIQSSNPTFPVNKVFSTLQKRAKGQGFASSDSFYANPLPIHNNSQEKSQQESDGNVHKLQRPSVGAEDSTTTVYSSFNCAWESPMSTPEQPPRANRLSRTRRLKYGSGKIHEVADHESERTNETKLGCQSPKASDCYKREPFSEDVLWTDKYIPQHSSEIIGNSAQIEKLHSWLKKWKLRTDIEERRKSKEKQDEENSNDCWDCGDFQDEEGSKDRTEEPLGNTILITGPPGVGKTVSVYACAKELGFKVFEVNCSSQRSGREVLTQLKEATQSHLVETSGKDPLKPAFFNSYNNRRCPAKSDTLPVKTMTPRNRNVSTSKKRLVQNRSICRAKANPVILTNYFKMKAKTDYLYYSGLPPAKKTTNKFTDPPPNTDQKVSLNKEMATSLILFEEVDVIFDDDVGFLTAIKTFMTTTKRPVILTTSDPLFREIFNSSLEEIIFKTPSMADVCSYLQLVCLAENVQLDWEDVYTLLKVTSGDVRRCLLQLQLWANSDGGQPKGPKSQQFNDRGLDCYKGCSANMLNLQSVSQDHVLTLLKDTFWTEQQMTELLQPMTESWRNGFPLLYSNLERLLHIEANGNSFINFDKTECSGPDNEITLCDSQQMEKTSGQHTARSTAKTKSRLSKRKNGARLTTPPSKLTQINHLPNETSQKTQYPADRIMNRTNCLGALSDFFDIMSFTDATAPAAQQLVAGLCHIEEFSWTGAKIQDGMADEAREEEGKSCSQERMLDIKATVEAVGFHACWRQVSEMCNKVQRCRQAGETHLEIGSFPESSNTKYLNLIFQPLCSPIVSQRRLELSKTVLSSRHFSQLHNRRAVCIDYMPVMRFICGTHRKQKHQQKEESVRCLKSLRTQLGLSKVTIQLLAEEFS